MKRSIIFISMMLLNLAAWGQTQEENINYIDIPSDMNIKDNIILVNNSPYTILRAVATSNDQIIGSCLILSPNCDITLANFDKNGLKAFKGKRIAIKIKGVKKILEDSKSTSIGGGALGTGGIGVFGVGVSQSELKADDINNIDPELITYDFKVSISEHNHDLYIYVYEGTQNSSAFDF